MIWLYSCLIITFGAASKYFKVYLNCLTNGIKYSLLLVVSSNENEKERSLEHRRVLRSTNDILKFLSFSYSNTSRYRLSRLYVIH